jgi:hypothetical protein
MDFGLQHVLGNLGQVDYKDLFAGSEYHRIIEALQHDGEIICRQCENIRGMDG